MKRHVYLDHNATTPLHSRAREAMAPYLDEVFGNPSSIHAFGRRSRAGIDRARRQVASLLGGSHREILFTSGGTEANNLAIGGLAAAYQERGRHIIVSAIEHHCVLTAAERLEAQGYDVTYLPVDQHGQVQEAALESALRDDTILVSIMLANNEVGTIQPVRALTKLAHARGALMHTDAVQAVSKLPLSVEDLGVDALSISSHKFYGPKAVGVLYLRKGTKIEPLIVGGGHERQLRAGTENVAGIVGMGEAAEIAQQDMDHEIQQLTQWRDRLEQGLIDQIEEVYVNGHPSDRMCNTVNLSFIGVEGESLIMNLDIEGIAVTSGAACTSGSLEPSHVLAAMGVELERAQSSLRLSVGHANSDEDIEYVLKIVPAVVKRMRAIVTAG